MRKRVKPLVVRRNVIRATLSWALTLWLVSTATATTWVDGEADDPFSDGKCHTPRVNSYGGYVYAWPSKYDIVYWPFIDPALSRSLLNSAKQASLVGQAMRPA